MQTITHLPAPSRKHATCAWCFENFNSVVELLDHVDNIHLEPAPAATNPTLAAA